MKKHSTDLCYLDYDDEGHLTCFYNHKAGEECLLDDREENEFYERVFNMAEFMNLAVPEIKTDPRHLDPRDEDFKAIEKTIMFRMFMLGKAWKKLVDEVKHEIKKLFK